MPFEIGGFEHAYGSKDLKAFDLSQSACVMIVEQYSVRMNFLGKKNGAELSKTERMSFS